MAEPPDQQVLEFIMDQLALISPSANFRTRVLTVKLSDGIRNVNKSERPAVLINLEADRFESEAMGSAQGPFKKQLSLVLYLLPDPDANDAISAGFNLKSDVNKCLWQQCRASTAPFIIDITVGEIAFSEFERVEDKSMQVRMNVTVNYMFDISDL